jgi:ABC-type nitrate/sulfonate/bicarbonate transport system ATPase subunit
MRDAVPTTRALNAPVKISVRGVTKVFQRKTDVLEVLQRVDIEVRTGEFVCLLGPSGCGKTTLLNIMGGFERPTAGEVLIDGARVTGPDPRRAFVFQEYGIFPWATVWENVALGLHARPADERNAIVRRYVDLVGLKGFENEYPASLSGGLKQRVAVARSLAVGPDVLYMDEPVGALDSLTRLQMRAEILRIWAQEKMTVLFVTHDVDESIQLADRVLVMSARPGRIAEIVPVEMPHPRDITSVEYGRIKRRLFELLGVNTSV